MSKKATPRSDNIKARVTIRAGICHLTRIRPASRPTKVASTRQVSTASQRGQPSSINSTPNREEVNATTEPTLRSTLPEIIARVMPQAIMPINETCRNTLSIFRGVKKLGAISERTMNKMIRASKRPERAKTTRTRSLALSPLAGCWHASLRAGVEVSVIGLPLPSSLMPGLSPNRLVWPAFQR